MKLIVDNVTKQYAGHTALNGVSISVPRGSVFGLLGPNGAGKTTLIRIINAITAPDSGSVLFDGEPLVQAHTARIGYLPEERGLYKKMKVGEQAIYLCRLKGLSKNDAMERLKYWFRKFEIENWWNRRVEELSKGMAQKVQFITTVLHEPELLIFDEPFSGFDPVNAELIKQEILGLRDRGATVIFSTHNMDSVERLCENIALINNSKVVLSGCVADIRNAHRTGRYSITLRRNPTDDSIVAPADITFVSQSVKHDMLTVEFRNNGSCSSVGSWLSYFATYGEIVRFEEVLPTMNDIFISTVSESDR